MITIYCGRCFYDYGRLKPLTVPVRITVNKETGEAKKHPGEAYCTFCGEERHSGGSHLRVREVQNSTSGEETTQRIPHIVTAWGKAI